MTQINHEILSWSRRTAGLTLEEASRKLHFSNTKKKSAADKLRSLETGESIPTKQTLEKMAQVYRRPLIIFYLEKIPAKTELVTDFRRKKTNVTDRENALLDALIRDVKLRQETIREIIEDEYTNESKKTESGSAFQTDLSEIFFKRQLSLDLTIPSAAKIVSDSIHFDITAFRRKRTKEDAFRYLRNCVEESGIFVLIVGNLGHSTTKLDTDVFRGFSLFDPIAPFVVVNGNDAKGALSFTLFHEVVHIFLAQSVVSNGELENKTESFCDKVASEILIPMSDLEPLKFVGNLDKIELISQIDQFAKMNNVSGSMLALRLYKINIISEQKYKLLHDHFYQAWLHQKEEMKKKDDKNGPTFRTTKRSQLGAGLLTLVHSYLSSGSISVSTAGKILGVAPRHVAAILEN